MYPNSIGKTGSVLWPYLFLTNRCLQKIDKHVSGVLEVLFSIKSDILHYRLASQIYH